MSLFAKLNDLHKSTETQTNVLSEGIRNQYRKIESLPSFIQHYLLSRISLGYSKQTVQRYIYDYHYFFQYVKRVSEDASFVSSNVSLEEFLQLEKAAIEHYISYLALEMENEPRTINRKISALQSLFDYLVKKGETSVNPISGVERPKVGKREPVFLTVSEAQRLLEAIRDTSTLSSRQRKYAEKLLERDYAVIYLLLSSGLRISELSSLKMKDYSTEEQLLKIRGKGNKERTIPLSIETINVMEQYLASIPQSYRPKKATDAVFIGYHFQTKSYSTEIRVSALQKMIQRQLKRARQHTPALHNKTITAHKLRHSFATALVANGVDVLTVQSLLGHESVATTQVYAHVQDQARQDAIRQLTIGLE
ncbi:tyrosine-type recombinase/integrase [Bacillus sp. FJAT-45037]|uniref:tyrosine-type recombinase/integrase n=1 Tax=Bacillus sp. FJAT-45037 TaxID=2011007 RepID=UPI000C24E2AC|nr:tyrosine-type recombinase/integrase [Bacillus sp. FJAT-45037]